jgi:hypothetical protein
MGTVLALSSPQFLAHSRPAAAVSETAWLTATIRPAGTFGRSDTSRLRALLDALSACASIVVLDLQAARLRSLGAGEVIEDAAWGLERRGGCLLCINVDPESHACLTAAGDHAVLLAGPQCDGDLDQDGRGCLGTRSVSSAKKIPNVSRTVTPDLSRTKTARSV